MCPYHNDPNPDPYWAHVLGGPGADPLLGDDEHKAMYGPCFNGAASQPMACIQHPALFPPEIFGPFFYPAQRFEQQPTESGATGGVAFNAIHPFLNLYGLSAYEPTVGPSGYGLGASRSHQLTPNWFYFRPMLADGQPLERAMTLCIIRVQYWLSGTSVYNTSSATIDGTVMQFLEPYLGTFWPAWAQFACSPGCHRDAAYAQRNFRSPADYGDKVWLYRCSVDHPPTA